LDSGFTIQMSSACLDLPSFVTRLAPDVAVKAQSASLRRLPFRAQALTPAAATTSGAPCTPSIACL
jgi:hypothetical protein